MPKYNFYDVKGRVVPEDLNAPVKKMLADDLRCQESLPILADFEKHKNCGEIQIFEKDTLKSVTIKTNYGMCEGFDLVRNIVTDKYVIISKKHIKNHNLSMKKTESGTK